jgi:ABC-type nitrate/sulfonate/bicarbonate transport system substrate-binding protein
MENRRKSMKKILMIIIVTITMTACAQKTANAIRVCLDWTPNTNHTGIYVALDKGWFSDKVIVTQPPENGALPLVAAGKADFAVDFQETMGPAIARKKNALPLEAVAAIINHNTSGVMSLAKSNIRRPRDMEGKRVDAFGDPVDEKICAALVAGDGGNPASMKIIPDDATDALSALQTNVDAIWIYYAWEGIAALKAGAKINYMDIGKLNPVFDWYTPIIVTNTDFIKNHPDKVRAFIKALSRGYGFAAQHPDEAAVILLKYAPELDRNLVLRSQRFLAGRYQGDAPKWGYIDGKRWDAFYGWMFQNGFLETDIRGKGYTDEFLP